MVGNVTVEKLIVEGECVQLTTLLRVNLGHVRSNIKQAVDVLISFASYFEEPASQLVYRIQFCSVNRF